MTLLRDAPLPPAARARTVTAVVGPTNTGKTHLAIERMLGHESGVIGLPLRLLAREVYGRVVQRVGADQVALVTGEEKIVPEDCRYWVCTVEAMPRDTDAAFAAIDEVQLAGDLERGHVFTDRIMNLRGSQETLLLGAATVRPMLEKLLPGINVITRPRMSMLTYSGARKITRLPARSAIVAFSADEVYGIAELIRRQRGGAAVVLGSLSPRTRNAQVELFQSGDVEFLIATDAIGMGLNLDVDHIAFASKRKFDGYQYRDLSAAELGQVAGRAGRHTSDGTFGVTGRTDPFPDPLVQTLETHEFEPVKVLQWRNPVLDFSSARALFASLEALPREQGLTRAPQAVDQVSLEHAMRDDDVMKLIGGADSVRLLWDVCQVPDYRKIATANHAELVSSLFRFLAIDGSVPDDWFAKQVAYADRTEGDIDTLANRIAHIRTWTFVANRADWLGDPAHWQGVTRDLEDRLSDALHERLTQRFVDRRTSVLMRRLRENAMLEAEITDGGDVVVEGQHVGILHGFRFTPDSRAEGTEQKAIRAAAMKALASEIDARAEKLGKAANEEFVLTSDGSIRWQGELVGRLIASDDMLKPGVMVLSDEQLTGANLETVRNRLALWISNRVETLLQPLTDLSKAEDLEGIARGIAFRLVENSGIVDRRDVAEDVRQLDQDARAGLRKYGVRFGAYHIFVPALLKPAPSELLAGLWALYASARDGGSDLRDNPGLVDLPHLSASGRTSLPVDPTYPKDLYRIVGFRICGGRAVRVDILERLADLIRPILSWREATGDAAQKPDGVPEGGGGGFMVTVAMTSLLGCAGEDFASVLKSLGYRVDRKPAPESASPAEVETPPAAEAATDAPETSEAETGEAETGEAETGTGAQPEATDASIEVDTVNEPADAATGATEATAEATAVATAGDKPAEAAAADSEPAFIEIWRPAGRSQGRDRRPANRGRGRGKPEGDGAGETDGKRPRQGKGGRSRRDGRDGRAPGGQDRPGGRGKPGGQGKPGGNRPNRPRPAEREPDPDSPFAALAGLKSQLESKDEPN